MNSSATGEGLRDHQLEMLEARREVYVNRGRRVLLHRILRRGSATADDVYAGVDLPAGIDPRCLGAVPTSLAKRGIIRSAGYVKSTRPERHASPIQVWQLADRTAAEQWLREHPDQPDPAPIKNTQRPLPLGD